jgi:hypothetical protein
MNKVRTYSVTVGRPGEGLSDPPFFKVEADTITFEPDGTIVIRTEKANRSIRPQAWDWEVCQITRSR